MDVSCVGMNPWNQKIAARAPENVIFRVSASAFLGARVSISVSVKAILPERLAFGACTQLHVGAHVFHMFYAAATMVVLHLFVELRQFQTEAATWPRVPPSSLPPPRAQAAHTTSPTIINDFCEGRTHLHG